MSVYVNEKCTWHFTYMKFKRCYSSVNPVPFLTSYQFPITARISPNCYRKLFFGWKQLHCIIINNKYIFLSLLRWGCDICLRCFSALSTSFHSSKSEEWKAWMNSFCSQFKEGLWHATVVFVSPLLHASYAQRISLTDWLPLSLSPSVGSSQWLSERAARWAGGRRNRQLEGHVEERGGRCTRWPGHTAAPTSCKPSERPRHQPARCGRYSTDIHV